MYENEIFDQAVFGPLTVQRSSTASAYDGDNSRISPESQRDDLDALIAQSMLNFTSFQAADAGARVVAFDRGYRVDIGNQRFAFDMGGFHKLLQQDNPGIDLTFDEGLANYEPDPALVKKSKVPLWVIRKLGQGSVQIQRIW